MRLYRLIKPAFLIVGVVSSVTISWVFRNSMRDIALATLCFVVFISPIVFWAGFWVTGKEDKDKNDNPTK